MNHKSELEIAPYLEKLFEIYREIDNAYDKSARFYQFSCKGCDENCCDNIFYHHTLIEYFGLIEGFEKLEQEVREESIRRAKTYLKKLNKHRGKEEQIKLMCPLNYDGLCIIYDYRPLICRIHGLPGELNHPKKGRQQFSGCRRFERIAEKDRTEIIDRTAFYTQIATLESKLRYEMDYMMKFHKTIAEMLLDRNL
jgi:Fe-S-cluster containining protein